MIDRICSLLKIKKPALTAGLLLASGNTVPTAGTAGYQVGCVFQHTDGGAETALYVNEGTVAECAFVPLLTTSSEAADLPDIGALAYTAGKILVADGDSYEEVAVSGDATLASTGALTIGNSKITTAKINDAAVTSAKLANGAGVAALLTAGLGGSASFTKTSAATTTLIAANAEKDRAVIVVVVVDETYAIGTGTLPTVKIGEDDTVEKAMAATVLTDEAAGTVLVFAFTNTATKKIIVTTTAAVGDSTGGCSVTAIAIPTT